MSIYETIVENPYLLREVGDLARLRARLAGVSSFYEDPSMGVGIVEERPDGTRRMLALAANVEVNGPSSGLP